MILGDEEMRRSERGDEEKKKSVASLMLLVRGECMGRKPSEGRIISRRLGY